MAEENLYSVLGLERDVADADIKKAYKRLAMRYHPDRNKSADAELRFKKIQQAYSILSNPEKRRHYDQFGTMNGEAGNSFSGFGGFDGFGDFSDIFNNFFHQNSTSSTRGSIQKGRNLHISIEIDLKQAVEGCTREANINSFVACSNCDGQGAVSPSDRVTCPICGGAGSIQRRVAILVMQETCSHCSGAGKIIKNPCSNCDGKGRVREQRNIKIDIPAGIDNEDTLRLAGEGEAGAAGSDYGDLLVGITIKPHPVFDRTGDDLFCQMPISYAEAALGGEAKVPTLTGYKKVKIPKGMQSGRKIKIRGAGVKNLRSSRTGDLLCTIAVETPQNLSEKQAKLLREFDSSLKKDPDKHSPTHSSWLKRIKKLFS